MKMNKKKVFVLAVCVCLVAILSFASLAWFTDKDEVTNRFMVAGSEDEDPDDIFSVDVWERVDTDDNGEKDGSYTYPTGEGAVYKDILPGDDLWKEPVVENTGAYDEYIRVTITISDASVWQDVYGEYVVPLTDIVDVDTAALYNDEIISFYDADSDSFVYVLYYEEILPHKEDKVDDLLVVFTNVHIPEALTREQAAALTADGFNIKVVADAVQTENVGDNVIEAYKTVGLYTEAPVATAEELKVALEDENITRVILDPALSPLQIDYAVSNKVIDANGADMTMTFSGEMENVKVTNLIDTNGTDRSVSVVAPASGDITIANCSFMDANGQPFGGPFVNCPDASVTFDNCTFNGNNYGIYGSACGNFTVTNSTFSNTAKWAILVNGQISGDVLIDNNTFTNCTDGIFKTSVKGTDQDGKLKGDLSFTNNTLEDCIGHDGLESKMFATNNPTEGSVIVSGNTRDGVDFTPDATYGLD